MGAARAETASTSAASELPRPMPPHAPLDVERDEDAPPNWACWRCRTTVNVKQWDVKLKKWIWRFPRTSMCPKCHYGWLRSLTAEEEAAVRATWRAYTSELCSKMAKRVFRDDEPDWRCVECGTDKSLKAFCNKTHRWTWYQPHTKMCHRCHLEFIASKTPRELERLRAKWAKDTIRRKSTSMRARHARLVEEGLAPHPGSKSRSKPKSEWKRFMTPERRAEYELAERLAKEQRAKERLERLKRRTPKEERKLERRRVLSQSKRQRVHYPQIERSVKKVPPPPPKEEKKKPSSQNRREKMPRSPAPQPLKPAMDETLCAEYVEKLDSMLAVIGRLTRGQ